MVNIKAILKISAGAVVVINSAADFIKKIRDRKNKKEAKKDTNDILLESLNRFREAALQNEEAAEKAIRLMDNLQDEILEKSIKLMDISEKESIPQKAGA